MVGSQQSVFTSPLNRPKFLQEQKTPKATEVGTATHLILQQLSLTTTPTDSG